ncbi:MAG: glutathione S-transferase family protein [Myxococcales bacterium]
MDFFCGRMSGNSARSLFALGEAGAKFDLHVLDTRNGENRSPAYLAVNPMGKIPALADGAFKLWESNAINWYVAEKHPAAHLVPGSAEGRASVQRWLYFQTGHVTPACVTLFRATNARVRAFWNPPKESPGLDGARSELARFLPVVESALDGREWLEGTFSLADIAFTPHLALIAEGGFDFSPYPRLHAWLTRLVARPAWHQTWKLLFEEA